MIQALRKALEAMGIRSGDSLLIHSAFSSLKRQITPADFVNTVFDALDGGTLLFPTLSWKTVTPQTPVFHVDKTPACTGFLPEFFRTSVNGVKRSVHPTHSCAAIGSNALDFIIDHEKDSTPVGKNSPFFKLKEAGGKVMFLGCGTNPNTSMHGVEELVNPPYLYGDKISYTLTNYGGTAYNKVYTAHGFKNTAQNYDRLEPLMEDGTIVYGKILGADCVIMDAKSLWETALKKYRENPLYFVTVY